MKDLKTMSFEQFKESVLLKQHLPLEELTKLGLLDGIGDYKEIKEKLLGEVKDVEIDVPSFGITTSASYSKSNSLENMLKNRLLVL